MEKFQNAYDEALRTNEENTQKWEKSKNDLTETENSLKEFIKYPSMQIMVPLGSKALIPGKIVHTNEVTVCHGSGVFSDCSHLQAIEIIQHRKKVCLERLKDLKAEKELFENKLRFSENEDVFGQNNPDCQEILEEFDEEAEKRWQKRHAESVKRQKRQEAAEREKLRNSDKDDVLKLLEDLELMEELDEELENLEINDDETLKKLMSGQMHVPESKPRISYYEVKKNEIQASSTSNSASTSQSLAANAQKVANCSKTDETSMEDLVLLLKSYRAKLKNIMKDIKKDDKKTFNIYLDLADLEDEINDDIVALDSENVFNSADSDEEEEGAGSQEQSVEKSKETPDLEEADEISSEGESSKLSDDINQELVQELKESYRPDSEIQLKSKRRVSFSSSLENVHIIERNGMPPLDLPQNKTIQIYFRHSENLFIPTKYNDNEIVQHPADVYEKFKSCFYSSVTTKKSILKNKEAVPVEQKRVIVETASKLQNCYSIGSVMEHNGSDFMPENQPETSYKKKPSKFKLNRQKS